MREIKFRAWDKEDKYMLDWEMIKLDVEYSINQLLEMDRFEMMQFTGLCDKNGKEIYEGDIVQIDNTDEVNMWFRGKKALVECKPGRFRILIESGEANMMKEDMSNVIEVIGNIYENPDLLQVGGE
ncbi:hypothetical protein AYJ08_00295 [Brevibacillus sp. SKDU10]|uniref:YopX family protein n=1 Tax=Brevibacillus sp. SKDU10 TaxID=1247872 RepID=UPI0007C8A03E|nr:YopX family protein [Brevibacillus sp. SKDU10]OAJ75223.1 hypothetical protein AYJ08_00295 [Brevibacillus sp. SKDU10]